MKRKNPFDDDPSSDKAKRRKISPSLSTKTPHPNRDHVTEETISPLTILSNTFDKISPRPVELISKQLETKRVLLKKKRINLTDDEDNIIMEGDEAETESMDNEVEIGRGTMQKSKDLDQADIEFDDDMNDCFDPFNIEQAQSQNVTNNDHTFEPIPVNESEIEIDSENDRLLNDELPLSNDLISRQKRLKLPQNTAKNDDDISLPLEMPFNERCNRSISQSFGDVNISEIPFNDDSVERSVQMEEDEKAMELMNDSNDENRQNLSHTITQIDDDHTLIQITLLPQKQSTYSTKKRKRSKQRIESKENDNVLTPISRNLVRKLNKSSLKASTRSRRKGKVNKQRHERMEDMDASNVKKGRSYSMLDEMRQMNENDESFMNEVDREREEMRQLILNQSGLSQQWEKIQKRKKAKIRKKTVKKRRKKSKKQDSEYVNVRRPQMSEGLRENYKKIEEKQANFWKEIEAKMKNKEFDDDIKMIQNENEIHLKGRRCLTPPRIQKHLERRYRKLYENENNATEQKKTKNRKRKGQRVWFLNKKHNVLNNEQQKVFDDNVNNSLISVTPRSSDDHHNDDEVVNIENELKLLDDLVLPEMNASASRLSMISERRMSQIDLMQSENMPSSLLLNESENEGSMVSYVSGHLLSSIALSSINEEGEEERDVLNLTDPFAMVSDVIEFSSKSNEKSQASSSVAY